MKSWLEKIIRFMRIRFAEILVSTFGTVYYISMIWLIIRMGINPFEDVGRFLIIYFTMTFPFYAFLELSYFVIKPYNLLNRNLLFHLLELFNDRESMRKAIVWARFWMIMTAIMVVCLNIKKFVLWIVSIYPHHKFAPEVDASIIATIGSTFTLGLTLIVTFYFNRQTQLAMIEQSRANLKERVIEHRMRIYPELEEILKKIGSLYPDGDRDDWLMTIADFKCLIQDNKYYFSKKLREYLMDIYTFVMTAHKKTLSPQQVEEADKKLDQLISLCQAEIEKSLDLAALVDLD
jgi:hypothetical protein